MTDYFSPSNVLKLKNKCKIITHAENKGVQTISTYKRRQIRRHQRKNKTKTKQTTSNNNWLDEEKAMRCLCVINLKFCQNNDAKLSRFRTSTQAYNRKILHHRYFSSKSFVRYFVHISWMANENSRREIS